MPYDFDHVPVRRGTDSLKWRRYSDALPLWVADMDFPAPEPVLAALYERVAHGVFGYGAPPDELTETIGARMADLYQWAVEPEQIVYLPGLVCRCELHMGADTSWQDMLGLMPGDFFGVTAVMMFPLITLPGPFPQQADMLIVNRRHVRMMRLDQP